MIRKYNSKNKLRPTTSKVQLAIFSMIGHDNLIDKKFLDLYAGTGNMGMMAINYGVKLSCFVDSNPSFISKIKNKSKENNLLEKSKFLIANCETQLHKLSDKFDYVFADPPYNEEPFEKIMYQLAKNQLVHKKSKIFLEHSNKIGLKEYYEDKMRIQTKNYGDTVISVFQRVNN